MFVIIDQNAAFFPNLYREQLSVPSKSFLEGKKRKSKRDFFFQLAKCLKVELKLKAPLGIMR